MYRLDVESTTNNDYVTYSRKDKKDGFTIKFGGFSVHGTGWYILAKAGGGLSWQLKGLFKDYMI